MDVTRSRHSGDRRLFRNHILHNSRIRGAQREETFERQRVVVKR